MLLKCTKNLVVADQILIMKHDIIKILDSDTVEKGNSVVRWFDCEIEVSQLAEEGMEVSLSIHDIAEHFECLKVVTNYSTITTK